MNLLGQLLLGFPSGSILNVRDIVSIGDSSATQAQRKNQGLTKVAALTLQKWLILGGNLVNPNVL